MRERGWEGAGGNERERAAPSARVGAARNPRARTGITTRVLVLLLFATLILSVHQSSADPTAELAKEINLRGSSSPTSLTSVGANLFFVATAPSTGTELWKTDGTEAGTVLAEDIRPGAGSSAPSFLTNVSGTLFFTADDGFGRELWKSDGTEAGTAPVAPGGGASFPVSLTNVNGTLFFGAFDSHGLELWKSDGTDAGTVLVKDIRPGGGGSVPSSLTDVGGTLFFTADDGIHGEELWKSNGTEAGTVLVKDIVLGGGSPFPFFCSSFANVSGKLFFTASDGVSGCELWKSDGTEAGTILVKDIRPGAGGSLSFTSSLIDVSGILFVVANDGVHERELWKSDGTEAGTVLVKDIRPGGGGSVPSSLTDVGGTLFFTADDVVHGRELWKSDGTEAGTILVTDIVLGGASPFPFFFFSPSLTNVGGTLFFTADDGVHGREPWKSDGTDAATVIVKDIRPGGEESLPFPPTSVCGAAVAFGAEGPRAELTGMGAIAFFTADDGTGSELWKSDGTEAGTVLVKDISASGDAAFAVAPPTSVTDVNGTVFFSADDGIHGEELWKSNGTEAGTVLVKDIVLGRRASSPSSLTNVNGTLFFAACDFVNGFELWKSDGTEAGTVLVKDILPGGGSSSPSFLTDVGGTLFFRAFDGVHGVELWKSNGTEAGTVLVKDIVLGGGSPFPFFCSSFANVSGKLFFTASDGVSGCELWKSDGTEAGTILVKDILPGGGSSSPSFLTDVGGTLFFGAFDGVHGVELWKSNGTEAGTVLVKDIVLGGGGSVPSSLTDVGGTLFFTADDVVHGRELWKSDGTEAGTILVKDIVPGGVSSSPSFLTNVNGALFFSAFDFVNGFELWKSDGTEAGTVLVADVWPGSDGSSPGALTSSGGTLFFTANDGVSGRELWSSDGTEAGTVLVADVWPGSDGSSPGALTSSGGTLFFTANDGVRGRELWRVSSDANAAPVANDDSYSTPEDTTLAVAAPGVLANDTDDGSLSAVLVAGPSNASSFTLNADGSFTYTPSANVNGIDSFTYKADDGTDQSETATVTITVDPVNDPPAVPTDLGQFRAADSSAIAVGGFTTESTVVLKGTVSDPVEANAAKLEVEVKPIGTPFDGTGLVSGTFVASGSTAEVTATGLAPGPHHWRARTVDDQGGVSGWASFGANADGATDFEVHAITALLYNGGQMVELGTSFTPAGRLSSPAPVCVGPGRAVSFSLDDNPTTDDGPYALGGATTTAAGQATAAPVSTAGWLPGVYTVEASFAGSSSCEPSMDEATLTVASPGDAAAGGGWYTLIGSGRNNFGFTAHKVPKTNPAQYQGQLLFINNGKWRLKGTIDNYLKTLTSGAVAGTGNLYWWDPTLNGGLGDWVLSEAGVAFTISFEDAGSGGRKSGDKFGIHIDHVVVSPPEPAALPNSSPQALKGGDVRVK